MSHVSESRLSSDEEELAWTKVEELEMDVDGSLRSHYPTLLQRGCELLVAYSKFYKNRTEGCITRRGEFAKQGIHVSSRRAFSIAIAIRYYYILFSNYFYS